MKLKIRTAFAASLLVLASCGGTAVDSVDADSLASEAMSTMTDMVAILEGIQDKATAEAAVDDILKVVEDMARYEKERGELSPEDFKSVEAAADAAGINALGEKMLGEIGRAMSIEGVPQALEPMMVEMAKLSQ